MNATIQFWLLFAVLNSYFFIPRYLLEIFHSQFIPVQAFTQGSAGQRLRHFLIRRNYDVFRISVDFFLLVLLYPLVLKVHVPVLPYSIFLCIYFGLSLLYQVYYHSFHRIYQLDPVFFHDYLMLKTAVQIFFHDYGRKNLLMTIGAGIIGLSAALLIYYLVSVSRDIAFGPWSYALIGVLCIGIIYSVIHYPYSKYPQLTFQSQLQSFIRNLLISRRSKQSLAKLTLKYMKQFNVDPGIRLQEKPNIYFIVIESYGKIAIKGESFGEKLNAYAPILEESLHEHGWHMRSGYTVSPVTGGASWISYTSMLYGLNVRNQGVYLTMLKNRYMPEYDSLFHWLKRQDYLTFRISSLGGYEKMEIPYESYSRLYGIDHWIKYKDLEYRGEHYGFGPSPADQYALWKGDAMSDEISDTRPKAVFFITQNSHTPYDSPLEVAEDWQQLNHGQSSEKKPSAFWSRPKFEKYGEAIEYQLRYLVDFIVRKGTERDIFILIGDHQPPSLSIALDSFETPLHVISKNSAFVNRWSEFGLQPGLIPDDQVAPLRQEAMHWAMLRSLLSVYAEPGARLPVFLPQGIPY